MQTHDWMSYVGIIAGAIGAITGVSGAVMGYVSYRRSNKIKTLDLRIELRKALNNLHESLHNIDALIAKADASKRAVAAARGYFRSGRMERWNNDVESDKAELSRLDKGVPEVDESFSNLDESELESKLVELHKMQVRANGMLGKYESSLRSDDEERRQNWEEHLRRPNH